MGSFGIIDYLMKKAGFDPGPMALAFVLGSIIESSTRRSLLPIFGGDPTGFITRQISGTILAIFVALAVLHLVRHLLKRRARARSGTVSVETPASVTKV